MSRLRPLWADERGAALVEFALILPFMLLLLLGGVQALNLIETQRRMAHSATALADVVAQYRSVTDGDLHTVFTIGGLLMAPLPADTLGQRVMSFTADNTGRIQLRWCSAGAHAYAGNQVPAIPADALQPNQSVIVADVSYHFVSALNWLLPQDFVLQKRVFLRPRLVPEVVKTDAVAGCPAA